MTEICGYCKDTHGRHFLGCPHLVEAVKIDMWRIEHGLPAKRPAYLDAQRMPPRIDGVLQATEPVKEGDILVVNEGACTVSVKADPYQLGYKVKEQQNPIYGSAPAALVQEELLYKLTERQKTLANPKDIAGSKKAPLDLLPKGACEEEAWALDSGGKKYGYWNWRDIPITVRAYVSAIMRHAMAIGDGEWVDAESGRPHAAHIAATAHILIDAKEHGTLNYGQAKTN